MKAHNNISTANVGEKLFGNGSDTAWMADPKRGLARKQLERAADARGGIMRQHVEKKIDVFFSTLKG